MLEFLIFELSEKLYEVYKTFSESKQPRTKEGLIQILFDVTFILLVVHDRHSFHLEDKKFQAFNKFLQDYADKDNWTSRANNLLSSFENEVS